jgi:hypothetical protein
MYREYSSQRASGTSYLWVTILLLIWLHSVRVTAATVTLAWDASTSGNVAAYKIYYGPASGNYTNAVNAGLSTTATVSNLADGKKYYFVATAVDNLGTESDLSDETNCITPVVNQAPTISSIASQITLPGTPTPALPFTVGDAETLAGNLIVFATSSNPTLLPNANVVLGGSGANRTATLVPIADQLGTANVTLTVSDGAATASTVFQITVTTARPVETPPVISAVPNQVIAQDSSTLPVPFSVSDAETPADALTVTASSSDQTLVPDANIVLGGSAGNRTVTVASAPSQTGVANITLSVSDGNTNTTTSFSLTVQAPGSTPVLTLTKIGDGTITPALSSSMMKPGNTYSVTAKPGKGQVFAGWKGSIVSSSPRITFQFNQALNLQAVFVPSPFPPVAGKYSALFYEADEVRQNSSGLLSLSVNSRGNYSGKVQIGNGHYSFSGRLDASLEGTNAITKTKLTPVTVQFRLGTNDESDQVFGQIVAGSWNAAFQGDRAIYNAKTTPFMAAGTYTLVLPGDAKSTVTPPGHSYGAVRINTSGNINFAGALADGGKVSQSAPISKHGLWPFYASLYAGQGSLLSWLSFTNRDTDDLNGTLSWIKQPGAKSRFYTTGFTNEIAAIGSVYRKPAAPTDPLFNFSQANVIFAGGDLATDFTNSISLAGSKLSNTSPNKLSLGISASTGIFHGNVVNPAGGRGTPFGGAIFQKQETGYGFMLGTDQTSSVVFEQQ